MENPKPIPGKDLHQLILRSLLEYVIDIENLDLPDAQKLHRIYGFADSVLDFLVQDE